MHKREMKSAAMMAFAAAAGFASAQASAQISVQINGKLVNFAGTAPAQVDGRVLVPLRGIMESLGAVVKFDGAAQSVTATRGSSVLSLVIGNRNASVDGRLVTLDVPAQIVGGSTMVPLRFVGEALGADVKWQGATNTVLISVADAGTIPTVPGNTVPGNTAPGAPTITGFSTNATAGQYLQVGERLTVTLNGTGGGTANFSIPGVADRVEMREVRPGVYEGSYALPKDSTIGLNGANLFGRLVVAGKEQLIQASQPLAFDANAPRITGFSPAAADRLADRRPSLSASFDDGSGSGIDRAAIKVTLDGKEITSGVTRGENLLVYTPREDLTLGKHDVVVSVRDIAGNETKRSWSFTIADAANVVKTFTVEGPDRPEAGDVIKFRLEGEPGAKSVVTNIGEKVLDLALRETSPGIYTAEYTVKRTDSFGREKVVARFESAGGERFTVESKTTVGNVTLAPAKPTITTPTEGKLRGDDITVSGTATGAKRVEVKVDYQTKLLGVIGNRGTISTVTLDVDKDGKYTTEAINLKLLLGGNDTEYTVTVVGIAEDGTRSEAQTVRLTR